MLKNVLITVGVLLTLLLVLFSVAVYFFFPSKERVLTAIKDTPDNSAITIFKNDSLIVDYNADRIMPLASTVKIILAIEYAEQATSGIVDPDELVPLEELDKFYVKNTDGGAHPNWLKSVSDKIIDQQVPIREIAKGMIRHSSNANTEWLSIKLGLDNINNRLDSLEIENHSEIYYIVSALFVKKETFPDLNGSELEQSLRNISNETYLETINNIHTKLVSDTSYKNGLGNLSLNVQKVWSDNLPGSTTSEYANLMRKLNSKTYFSKEVHEYLDEVMEQMMERESNQKRLVHAGSKGGSTAFVLTKAFYATDKDGNTFEIAYFLNNLNALENTRLQMSLQDFEIALLTDDIFLNKLNAELN